MIFHLLLEAFKFQLLINTQLPIRFKTAVRSVFGGMALANISPNRVAEFAGRVIHLPTEVKKDGALNTFISGLGQLVITLFVGMCSLFLFTPIKSSLLDYQILLKSIYILKFATPFVLILFVLMYFSFNKIIVQFFSFLKWKKMDSYFSSLYLVPNETKLVVILFSLFRFIIFHVQYFLLFSVFEVNISLYDSFVSISIMFLFIAIIPSISYLELGLRLKLCLLLMNEYHDKIVGIISVVSFIWFINFIIPAFIGSFTFFDLFLSKKKKKGVRKLS